MHKNLKFLVLSLFLAILSGCGSSSQVLYLQNAMNLPSQEIRNQYDLRIKKDDKLAIRIFSKEAELAAPFNMSEATTNTEVQSSLAPSPLKGLLVNSVGEIDYPVLGRLKVEGLTLTEVSDMIRNLLISEGYIQNPIVSVAIVNFKISVLGEVVTPGIIEVQSERITLFEAISKAGDLSIYGKRNKVKIIREKEGTRKVFEVDLTDPNLLYSDLYYLQQNDLIYVEPNSTKIAQRSINPWIGTGISVISFLMTLGLYFFK